MKQPPLAIAPEAMQLIQRELQRQLKRERSLWRRSQELLEKLQQFEK